MDIDSNPIKQESHRRKRLHDILIALVRQQEELELLDPESSSTDWRSISKENRDPASWIDRNRRVLKKYQALVRSAITLDALLDAEEGLAN